MAEFPSTTEELEQLISDYMTAHLAEQMEDVTSEQIAQAVAAYMQQYGAAIENNSSNGDVPLIPDNALDAENAAMPGPQYEMQAIMPDPSTMAGIEVIVTFAGSVSSVSGVLLICYQITGTFPNENVEVRPDSFWMPDYGSVNYIPLRRGDNWVSNSYTPNIGNSKVINGKQVSQFDYPSVTLVSNGYKWFVVQRQVIER